MSSRKNRKKSNASPRSETKNIRENIQFEDASSSKRQRILSAVFIFLAVFLTYSGTLGHDFVWDDNQFIVNDTKIQSLRTVPEAMLKPLGWFGSDNPAGSLWRPLTTLSFALDAAMWRDNPFGFHLTNVILHSITALILYFVFLSLLKNNAWAVLLTLLYALHPIHAEPVAFINGRHSILAGIFVLISFLLHRKSSILASLTLLLAVYSRETSIMLPFALLIYDWSDSEEPVKWSCCFKSYAPYAIVIIIYCITRFMVLGGIGKAHEGSLDLEYYSWKNRIWMQPMYFMEYFKMIFTPVDLHMWMQIYFPKELNDPKYLKALSAFTVFIAAMIAAFRKNRSAFFGACWFILFLLPVLNLFIIANSPVLNHWLYLPFIGFIIFVFMIIRKSVPNRFMRNKFLQAGLAVCILSLGIMSSGQSMVWKNEISTFEHISRFVTRDPLIYNNLGTAYIQAQEWVKAKAAYEKALEIDPGHENSNYNLRLLRRSHPEIF